MVFGAGFREREKGLNKASRFEAWILKRGTAAVLQEIFVGRLQGYCCRFVILGVGLPRLGQSLKTGDERLSQLNHLTHKR